MSPALRVLGALILGIAIGVAIASNGSPGLVALGGHIETVGTLWVNAIRMTVIPLIVASLIAGIATAGDGRSVGRLAARLLPIFVVILAAAALFSVLVAPPILAWVHLDPQAAVALRAQASGGTPAAPAAVPTLVEWLVSLVPTNPVKAASDGTILPLIVFSLAFGAALLHVDPDRRAPLVRIFQSIAQTMLILVRAILVLAPIGVFGLAVPLAMRLGLAAAGAVASYIAIVVGMCLLAMLGLHLLASTVGRVPIARFARGAAPAQAVAFSSRSSLAALPAMLEGAIGTIGIAPAVANFLLPLAAGTFRVGGVIGQTVGVLFIARLYETDLGTAQLAAIGTTAVLTSFTVPGIPGGSILVMLPVLLAAGMPAEGIGILLGVDTLPDMFRTTTNVTGHLAAATILARGEKG